jgi:hypothetical protein
MFSNPKTLGFLGATMVLAGCGDDDLPEYYLLDRMRVIAAVSNSPEVASSATGINVTFHVSDPNGAGRTLSYRIEKCVDPGIGLGATPTCTGNPTAALYPAETGNFAPGSAATNYYGTFTTANFDMSTAAAVIFLDPATGSIKSTAGQYNGSALLVIATITAPTGETTIGFKRIVASTRPTKNQNPTFNATSLLFNGVAPGSYTLTTERFPVRASVPSSSQESYLTAKEDGSFESASEALTVTWLVSAGSMRYSRTDPSEENRYTPTNPLPAKTSFIAVLRDDRGGATVVDFHKP